MRKLAPIVLFTYNRLWHTQQTIEALQKNELAEESELFIYSDGGKDEESWLKVNKVRKYLKTINGFKNITIIEQEKNIGLADSIISGVTKIVNQYGKIIVLEDDIVTSPYFLRFMNDALDFYENEEKVWHISGWNYPIELETSKEIYLSSFGNTWGWGTWSNKWSYFKKDTDYLINTFDETMIYKFNIDNSYNFWEQILLNKEKKINTWAIYWYATLFLNNALFLNPIKSLVKNIGFDGTGENCKTSSLYLINEIEFFKIKDFTSNTIINNSVIDKIKLYYATKQKKDNSFINNLRRVYKQLDFLKESKEEFLLFGAGSGAKLIINYMPESITEIVVSEKTNISYILNKNIITISDLSKRLNQKIIVSSFGYEEEIKQLFIKNNINLNNLIFLI